MGDHHHPILERLAQDLQHVAAARRPFIQQEHPMVGQRHVAWHWHLPATDQPHIWDGMMRGPTRPGGDDGGAVAGEAGDALDARGLDSFGGLIAARRVVKRRYRIEVPAPMSAHVADPGEGYLPHQTAVVSPTDQ
jgi:hypothetical protein